MTGMIQPWVRDYNYIKDYFDTVYDYYSQAFRAYPITYYSLDLNNTIWEDSNLMGGSYEKAGVGELSGVLWKKILMLPVYGIEQIQPSITNTEKGQTYYDSLNSTVLLPSTYNLKPIEGDVIDLNYGLTEITDKNISPLFVVTNVNMATHSNNLQLWNCKVKVAPFGRDQLEKQISKFYMFLDSQARILSLNRAIYLLGIESKTSTVSQKLNTLFDNNTGCYLVTRETS